MLPKLTETPQYKEDLSKWKAIVNNLQDEKVKVEMTKKIDTFCVLANRIDDAHNTIMNGNINPGLMRDNRLEFNQLRYQIMQDIKHLTS